MSNLAKDLVDNPKTFLQRLRRSPLFIDEPSYAPALKLNVHTRLETGKAVSVMGRDRVCYCKIGYDDATKVHRAELDPDYSAGDYDVACYWLPWMKDGIVRIKLRTSKSPGSKPLSDKIRKGESKMGAGVAASDEAFEWKPRTGGPESDVELFFTGMMDGCSTWATGDPAEPEVYHVNCASYQGSDDDDTDEDLLRKGIKGEKAISERKTKQMKSDFLDMYAPDRGFFDPKYGSATPVKANLAQHKPGGVDAEKVGAYMKACSDMVRRLVGGSRTVNYKVMRQTYAAFGVKHNSRWKFYRQNIFEYRLADENWNQRHDMAVQFVADEPEQFFP
jgi:hypothetical protein